jgi:uncharacterized protein YqgC (DUF456 family)
MTSLSSIWGTLALIGMVIGFFPCFGALNWINIPFAAVGLVISLMARQSEPPAQRSQLGTGVIGCSIAILVGLFRLIVGGGVF